MAIAIRCKIVGEVSLRRRLLPSMGRMRGAPLDRLFWMSQWKDAQSRLWIPEADGEGNRVSPVLREAGPRVWEHACRIVTR